jgi:hypothetical protein
MDRAHIVPLGPSANFQGMAGLPLITAGLTLWGLYTVEILDEFGKVIDFVTAKNDVTNEGLNNILDVQFHAVTQVTTWYIGLIDASGFSDLADSDTLASHAGWTEFTNYTGNRQEWTEGAAAGGVMTNSTTVDFAILGSGTIAGMFLASVASGTAGKLWSTALFAGGDVSVSASQTLKVTYTINAIRS